MNFISCSKYGIKKIIANTLPQYKCSKENYLFLKRITPAFLSKKITNKSLDKKILIASMGYYDIKTEAIYVKALEDLGYEAIILTWYDPFIKKTGSMFGIDKACFYEDYFDLFSLKTLREESVELINKCSNAKDILNLKKYNIQIGKYAASSVMRQTRLSSIDLNKTELRKLIIEGLSNSLKIAIVSQAILDKIRPDLFFVTDRGYSPVGEFFDTCLNKGIPVIQRCGSHKSGYQMLKLYNKPEMSSVNHSSLSKESWDCVKNMHWNDSSWKELHDEIKDTYISGDWFSEVGTQFNKRLYTKKEIFSKLQIDSDKKVAVIFPHMFWDATFFWGEDIFNDYYDWFVNVLKIAALNKNINWIIKIHPANIIKAKRDHYSGEHKELIAIRETLGKLPDHIKVISPESDINTFSFFSIMDYCLTVRGTIGIEASAFGINTFTAGTGRYDRKGFTHDFNSREDYISCIRYIENICPMSKDKIELARRYAYGIFILRPIYLDLLEHRHNQDEKASIKFSMLFKTKEEFEASAFVKEFRQFVLSGEEDYLNLNKKVA